MIRLRQPIESDWKPILDVVNLIVPGDDTENQSWVENRRNFDEDALRRRHYTVEENGHVVGYGYVEETETEPGWFRVHICLPNERLTDPVAHDLHAKLWESLQDSDATGAWARDWSTLTEVADYFQRLGYVESGRYATGDRGIVVWKKPLAEAA